MKLLLSLAIILFAAFLLKYEPALEKDKISLEKITCSVTEKTDQRISLICPNSNEIHLNYNERIRKHKKINLYVNNESCIESYEINKRERVSLVKYNKCKRY